MRTNVRAIELANMFSQRLLAAILNRHVLNVKRGEDVTPLPS
jgi:hypothetical protein